MKAASRSRGGPQTTARVAVSPQARAAATIGNGGGGGSYVDDDDGDDEERLYTAMEQGKSLLQRTASGYADGAGGYDPRTGPTIAMGRRQEGKKSEYELDQDDLDYQKEQLQRAQRRLMAADKEHIKATINSIDDIESGVWAAPFFGAFAAMRLLLMVLCGQLITICSVVFSEGGLAFPAWICFSLAIATLITGFPTWWEPMTNNHARLHIIVSALSAIVTGIICIFLAEKFEVADSRQRGRVVGLYAGLAVLEFLGCFFAVKVKEQTNNVDLYVRARLIEWRHDVEKGVFQKYVAGGRADSGARAGGGGGGGPGAPDGSESDDESQPLMRHVFRDPQLVEINQKIEELTKRNNFLEGTASGLQDLLNASKKREKDHLQQNLVLVAKAQRSEDLTRDSLLKLETFEKDMRFVAADKMGQALENTNQLVDVLQERVQSLETQLVMGTQREFNSLAGGGGGGGTAAGRVRTITPNRSGASRKGPPGGGGGRV